MLLKSNWRSDPIDRAVDWTCWQCVSHKKTKLHIEPNSKYTNLVIFLNQFFMNQTVFQFINWMGKKSKRKWQPWLLVVGGDSSYGHWNHLFIKVFFVSLLYFYETLLLHLWEGFMMNLSLWRRCLTIPINPSIQLTDCGWIKQIANQSICQFWRFDIRSGYDITI